ncbi:hypothetical protein TELCIR_16968, partial [Teladorsagia circumcincta]
TFLRIRTFDPAHKKTKVHKNIKIDLILKDSREGSGKQHSHLKYGFCCDFALAARVYAHFNVAAVGCDDEERVHCFADRRLLWKNRPCPNCGISRKVTKQQCPTGGDRKWKFECNLRSCRQPGINRKIGYLKGTFLSLCMYYSGNVGQLGGPNTIVQVDESNIVLRKCNVSTGRVVRRDWLFGGIQDETKMVFVEIVDRRDAATMRSIIQRHISGGTIRTDMWSGYNNLFTFGYIHNTANHGVNFVDPMTGVHTQRVEGLWSTLKERIRRRHGTNRDLWDDHFFDIL